jgi:uncharacterized UPF0146 family protein
VRKSCEGLVDYISRRYSSTVEIGVGAFPDVALALTETGVSVFATDIRPFEHRGLKVMVDDITRPWLSLYNGLDLIYSLRPPSELVPYMQRLAKAVSADLIVKPLCDEHPGGQLTRMGNTTFFQWSNL